MHEGRNDQKNNLPKGQLIKSVNIAELPEQRNKKIFFRESFNHFSVYL